MSDHGLRAPYILPPGKRAALARATRVEWLTLALRVSVVIELYLLLGSTQALTAIWLKSLWALLPPTAFLAASRIEGMRPTPRFPHGFYRATSIAFLGAAIALACMGIYLAYAALGDLLAARHPELATFAKRVELANWPGWPIVAGLLYSIAVPFIAGGSRRALAITLHDKGLYADTAMGRVNWLAGSAAVIGVIGVGLGFWWADFLAALVIGLHVLWHGWRHLRTAVCDLIDEVPRALGSSEIDPLAGQIRARLERLQWVDRAWVRLREEGRLITGIVFIEPRQDDDLLLRLEAARADIAQLDWRLLDIQLVPIPRGSAADAEVGAA